jgi:hypothetical protein
MGEGLRFEAKPTDGHFAQRAHWPKDGELDLRNEANQKFEELATCETNPIDA